ncbi:helix-turn-helix transcriptional regulator [Ornithinimicrobium sp. CNJ-824]|uniref:helix-turn-helix transcriptional regulator n=1 Tax=Ornithinimicrobium sp. CNJ-824 TaxID=1904966 RepID=UPI0016510BB0|nr:helix-turn-helix transcriptional regulator [Ornithinimicrobium sp. CNJ-824]
MATLRRARASGARARSGPPLMCLFLVALHLGDLPRAGRLLGMLGRHLDVLRPALPPAVAVVFDRAEGTYHAATGEAGAHEVAWGGHLSHDEAIDAALELARELDRTARQHQERSAGSSNGAESRSDGAPPGDRPSADDRPGTGDAPRTDDELTARERQVLEELVSGATNREISAHLGISPKTVMHHTSSIYRKLSVRGRAEAVAHHLRHAQDGRDAQTGRAISRSR